MDKAEREDLFEEIRRAESQLSSHYHEPQMYVSPDMSQALEEEMNTTRRPRWDKVRETKFWDGYLP